ncbi:hypothetical protein SO802_006021 [Lithocarpus litseifolius]|uniref:Uncharacterized protein n=1 Tax=Lithocarpus litseifolius TaxID=425828 RepID=A0AAW2DMU8_9ROSI
MSTVLMVSLVSMRWVATQMSWVTLFRRPTIQRSEELVWLVENLKLEMTEYSWQIYDRKGYAFLGGDDDDNDDGGGGGGNGGGDLEATPSYQARIRLFSSDLAERQTT